MPQALEPIYLGLRTQVLIVGPENERTSGALIGDRVAAGLYELGYEEFAVTFMAHRDGSCSMYTSNGGGNIGAGAIPAIAAAGAAFLDALERDIALLQPVGDIPPVPAPMTIRFTAVTGDGLRSVVVDLTTESPDGHPLARLNDAGQDLVTQFRLHSPEAP